MRVTKLLLILALAAGVACGKESGAERDVPIKTAPGASSVPAASGPNAKAAFVKAANAACREYDAADMKLDDPETLDQYVPFLEEFIRIGDRLDAKLRAIPAPAADAKQIADYIARDSVMSKVLADALVDVKAAVRANDIDAADSALNDGLDEFDRLSESLDAFARGYGLLDCANAPDDSSDTQG